MIKMSCLLASILCLPLSLMAEAGASPRTVLSLDGTWQIAEGNMESVPASFDHNVPVPGLVTLAQPAFD